MSNKVRMADIAEQLGVSIVTVSKALNGKGSISRVMREKILLLAREMGYVPLRAKPVQKKGSATGIIGILVADHFFEDSSFYAGLYRQILKCCNEESYSALLELVTPEAERSCTLPAMVQGGKVDAVIFMGEISRAYLQEVAATGLPYMLLDFHDGTLNASSVNGDNIAGGYQLTKHLLSSGRRKIAFVGSIHATSSIMDRFLGYTKALLESGLHPRHDWILEDRGTNGLLTPLELPKEMPEAFVCSYDVVAHDLIDKLKAAGYRVPEDVAVTGYDDMQLSQFSTPRITTYRVDTGAMARITVQQMLLKIKGKSGIRGNITVPGTFLPRDSG